jgi:hypothetical protein
MAELAGDFLTAAHAIWFATINYQIAIAIYLRVEAEIFTAGD